MTTHPLALTLPPRDDEDDEQRPETDIWVPGHVTFVTRIGWAPDRHDATEARADR